MCNCPNPNSCLVCEDGYYKDDKYIGCQRSLPLKTFIISIVGGVGGILILIIIKICYNRREALIKYFSRRNEM
jgi:hypothetical protein